jgi:hypothetical protein
MVSHEQKVTTSDAADDTWWLVVLLVVVGVVISVVIIYIVIAPRLRTIPETGDGFDTGCIECDEGCNFNDERGIYREFLTRTREFATQMSNCKTEVRKK